MENSMEIPQKTNNRVVLQFSNPTPRHESENVSPSVVSDSLRLHGLQPPGSSIHRILQARILEVRCYFLLQGIFPTQGSNPGLLYCRQILYCLSHKTIIQKDTCTPIFIEALFTIARYGNKEPEIKLRTSAGSQKKTREFKKKRSTSVLLTILKPLTVQITTNWKIQKMGIPNHLTYLLRNLYAGQEATV